MVPARVFQSRSRYPLRWFDRVADRSPWAAPVRLYVEIHHAVDDERHHLPEEICVGALFNQVFESHSIDGHGIRVLPV